jgi:glycerol-3-phosphate dehydrogenase
MTIAAGRPRLVDPARPSSLRPNLPPVLDRARSLSALSHTRFDVLVVGGGATGAGVARDAATRGLAVALVEASDFAAETSSHSSQLIHGGLRYLQYFDFALVFEALRERRYLMKSAPHLCRPVQFLFPAYRGLSPRLATLGAGIALYNALALWRPPVDRRRWSRQEVFERVPGIRTAGLEGAQTYLDCQTDDARLVLETVLDARAADATTVPRFKVVRLLRDRRGRIAGALGQDQLSGAEIEIAARVVVNATGPFSDAFDRGRRNLRPTLGVHIVLDARRLPHGGRAVVLRSPRDGRLVFLLPHDHRTIIGTTDTDWTPRAAGPSGSAMTPQVGTAIFARASDVDYLLEVANHAFPPAELTPGDVVSTFAGLRPLVAAPAHTASSTSREHEIFVERDGLITVVGGKLTTFRHMAEQTTDLVVDRLRTLGFEGPIAPCSTATRTSFAAPEGRGEPAPSLGNIELAPDVEDHLRRTYGRLASTVAAVTRESSGNLDLAARIYPDLPFVWAEVLHAARSEMVTSIDDVLRRRINVFRDAPDQGLGVVADVARVLGTIWDWSPAELDRAIRSYQTTVAASRSWSAERRASTAT